LRSLAARSEQIGADKGMDGSRRNLVIEGEPEGLLAARLTEIAASTSVDLIMIARSETRAARLHRAIATLAPRLTVLLLPAWDCLPYDRASPSRATMGARM